MIGFTILAVLIYNSMSQFNSHKYFKVTLNPIFFTSAMDKYLIKITQVRKTFLGGYFLFTKGFFENPKA